MECRVGYISIISAASELQKDSQVGGIDILLLSWNYNPFSNAKKMISW